MLKDHCDIRARLCDRSAVHDNFAAVARYQAVDNSQQCRLTATARPQNANAFVRLNVNIDVLQGDDIATAVSLGEISNDDLGHAKINDQGFPCVA